MAADWEMKWRWAGRSYPVVTSGAVTEHRAVVHIGDAGPTES
jgi:hypothetical protein